MHGEPQFELAACKVRLRAVCDRLERCIGATRAAAATLPILTAIHEIEEIERWNARRPSRADFPPIGSEPFNPDPGDMEAAW